MSLRVHFTDFPGPANPDAMLRLLRKRHEVELDAVQPDILFFSVFGYEFLKYQKPIRVFFTGENVHPDFNLCDYALGFDWLTLEDRYFRCPNFLLYEEYEELMVKKPLSSEQVLAVQKRSRFCNFIYSNAKAHPFRDQLFRALNERKKVDSAGLHLNNTGIFRGSPSLGAVATKDKIEFQKECRFTLAIENSSTPGYTTEKLIHALVADTIPIYWGDPVVGRQFNTKRFINCHEYNSLADIVNRVLEIDENPELSKTMLHESIFCQGQIPFSMTPEAILSKLDAIIHALADAKRRNPFVWGRIYEERLRKRVQESESFCARLISHFIRKIKQ